MIYILHGDDTKAAYQRSLLIVKNYPQHTPIKLEAGKNNLEEFSMALFGQDLLSPQKIIIAENFLTKKMLSTGIIRTIPKEKIVILWEKSTLKPQDTQKLSSVAKIETFKIPPTLFHFLDSLSTSPRLSLNLLHKNGLGKSDESSLIWNLTNRIVLLILAKLNAQRDLASAISNQNLQDWQWQKITSQAKMFDLETLQMFLQGALKVDFLIKTGSTNIPKDTLISLLLLKYLKNPKMIK